jgi:hypothetical protein
MKFFPLLIAVIPALALLSCSSKNEQFTQDLCYPTNRQFKVLDINDEHLKTFNNDLKVMERGHFLRGVYEVKGEIVYASIYEGAKTDSLLLALTNPNESKNKLGEKCTWWTKDSTLYLNSPGQLVMVSFPENLSSEFIPSNGSSILFELCD